MKMVDRQLQRMDQVPRPVGLRTQPCCNVSFLVQTSGTQNARTNKPAHKNMVFFDWLSVGYGRAKHVVGSTGVTCSHRAKYHEKFRYVQYFSDASEKLLGRKSILTAGRINDGEHQANQPHLPSRYSVLMSIAASCKVHGVCLISRS